MKDIKSDKDAEIIKSIIRSVSEFNFKCKKAAQFAQIITLGLTEWWAVTFYLNQECKQDIFENQSTGIQYIFLGCKIELCDTDSFIRIE